jgi:hypothetical protein
MDTRAIYGANSEEAPAFTKHALLMDNGQCMTVKTNPDELKMHNKITLP